MKKRSFQVVFWKEGKFTLVECAELGVVTQGLSLSEALYNVEDAIQLYLGEKTDINIIHYPKPFLVDVKLDFKYPKFPVPLKECVVG